MKNQKIVSPCISIVEPILELDIVMDVLELMKKKKCGKMKVLN